MYEINRSVFLLMPLEPFWRWLQSLPDVNLSDIELEDLQADANASTGSTNLGALLKAKLSGSNE